MVALHTLLLSLILPCMVVAVEWHALQYYTANNQRFTSLSGDMVVPPITKAATYYLWPGLQPTDNSGVFQPVLDGRSGMWWIGWGWCCSNPSLPWGAGFNVEAGDVVRFNAVLNSKAKTWDTSLTVAAKGLNATGTFALADKVFNMAVFAIELYDASWDFGPLQFRNVHMGANGRDLSFCRNPPANLYGSTNYTSSTPKTWTDGNNRSACRIDRLTLQNPL